MSIFKIRVQKRSGFAILLLFYPGNSDDNKGKVISTALAPPQRFPRLSLRATLHERVVWWLVALVHGAVVTALLCQCTRFLLLLAVATTTRHCITSTGINGDTKIRCRSSARVLVLWREGDAGDVHVREPVPERGVAGHPVQRRQPAAGTDGVRAAAGGARPVAAPSGWSGRMWARTGCSQDGATGRLVCATGDCGAGGRGAGAGAALRRAGAAVARGADEPPRGAVLGAARAGPHAAGPARRRRHRARAAGCSSNPVGSSRGLPALDRMPATPRSGTGSRT
ncbi:hypothetical protein EJB05_57344, partial [Eragrostis curvula]